MSAYVLYSFIRARDNYIMFVCIAVLNERLNRYPCVCIRTPCMNIIVLSDSRLGMLQKFVFSLSYYLGTFPSHNVPKYHVCMLMPDDKRCSHHLGLYTCITVNLLRYPANVRDAFYKALRDHLL